MNSEIPTVLKAAIAASHPGSCACATCQEVNAMIDELTAGVEVPF